MKDRDSGKSRGFGFVSFDTEEAVEQVLLKLKEHKLLDKWVECKNKGIDSSMILCYIMVLRRLTRKGV